MYLSHRHTDREEGDMQHRVTSVIHTTTGHEVIREEGTSPSIPGAESLGLLVIDTFRHDPQLMETMHYVDILIDGRACMSCDFSDPHTEDQW